MGANEYDSNLKEKLICHPLLAGQIAKAIADKKGKRQKRGSANVPALFCWFNMGKSAG
jgi:hypothetical protein